MLRFPGCRGEVRVAEATTAFANAVIFDGVSAELREGCVRIAVAVANGVRSIEHGNLLDAPAADLMAERGAFLVPTLVTYDAMERRGAELGLAPVAQAKNREVLTAGRTAIGLAREAGVRIGFGTDLMGPLDDEQLHGLRLQAEVEGTAGSAEVRYLGKRGAARRLTELGLSLGEAGDVLAGDAGRDLVEILRELDADLARQEADLRQRRARLAELLRQAEAGGDLEETGFGTAFYADFAPAQAAKIRCAIDLMKESTL
jgi:Amidohydrolase family